MRKGKDWDLRCDATSERNGLRRWERNGLQYVMVIRGAIVEPMSEECVSVQIASVSDNLGRASIEYAPGRLIRGCEFGRSASSVGGAKTPSTPLLDTAVPIRKVDASLTNVLKPEGVKVPLGRAHVLFDRIHDRRRAKCHLCRSTTFAMVVFLRPLDPARSGTGRKRGHDR